MKIRLTATLLLLTAFPLLHASEDEAENEEYLVLSPFTVDTAGGDSSYAAASSLAGARLAANFVEPNSAARVPDVPITITKRAEALVVSFTLANFGDKQEKRNSELYASVESLRQAVAQTPGLRFEHREVRFAPGNRSKLSIGRSGATTSHAAILILADLPEGVDVVKQVKSIRDTVQKATLHGQTKLVDGTVGLYLKNPAKYRREILDRIFEDLNALKASLGAEFEVLPSGLNKAVQMRISSETDIELWIDYSFTIRSIRELTTPKK